MCTFDSQSDFSFLQEPQVSPDNVLSSVDGTDTLTFIWDQIPCGNRSGDIVQYRYQLLNKADNTISVDTVLAPKTNITIPGLDPCTTYSFRVSAETNGGSGPYSDDVISTTDTAGK